MMAEVHLIGQIKGATDFTEDKGLFVKWSINVGSCWEPIEGHTQGQTHLSFVTTLGGRSYHSWSHPIDVHYSTRSLQGWPRFELQVMGVDWLSRCNISAYGFLNIPSRPGTHRLTCSTWRPIGDLRRRVIDYITGYRMHLLNPSDVISNGLNRHIIQSVSMGTIILELNVVLKDFGKYGVDI